MEWKHDCPGPDFQRSWKAPMQAAEPAAGDETPSERGEEEAAEEAASPGGEEPASRMAETAPKSGWLPVRSILHLFKRGPGIVSRQ